MDKVKLVLNFFKRNLFWFISASTIIAVVVFWWWSTGTLAKEFVKQEKEINDKINTVDMVLKDSQHPTPDYIKAINDKHAKLKQGVLAVWTALYNEQKEKNPWPKDLLGKDFTDVIDKLGPDDRIPEYLRANYQERIKEYFSVLTNIIDLRRLAEKTDETADAPDNAENRPRGGRTDRRGLAPGGRGIAGGTVKHVGAVDWAEPDQEWLKERLKWPRTPTTLQVKLTQENLWVYETLLRVIRETNEGAADQSQANVKRIEWIKIGEDAIQIWSGADQKVFRPQQVQESVIGQIRTKTEVTASAATAEGQEEMAKNRYVDEKGAPLDANAKQPYDEFKMMPISMKLFMDQRKISKLLVECSNRSMPIEVQRVRIRPGEGEILSAGSLSSGGPGGDRAEGSRRPGAVRRGSAAVSAVASFDQSELGPLVVPVEIQGVIYIYNPPAQSMLGTDSAQEKTAETAAAANAGAPAAFPEGVAP